MIEFTKTNVSKMTKEIAEVLNKYGFKNVEFSTGSARYSANEFTVKVIGNIKGVKSNDVVALERAAKIDGINITKVGPGGEQLIAFHPRKRKYPYIYQSKTGKQFKITRARAQAIFA